MLPFRCMNELLLGTPFNLQFKQYWDVQLAIRSMTSAWLIQELSYDTEGTGRVRIAEEG